MKLAVPDLISNSYFPAVAAVELGLFRREGLEVELELIFPVDKSYEALRDGRVTFVAGSAHSAVAAFPEWKGVRLLAAQGQGMYWFLVLRKDLAAGRGNLAPLHGRRISAAPWVEMGLRQLLIASGHDPAANGIEIAPVPGAVGAGTNFGLTAARALAEGRIDGFWANGMAAEIAIRNASGAVVLDVRRGDGPAGCFDYTMASVAATSAFIEQNPKAAAAAVRAIRAAHAALNEDPSLATGIGRKLFPPAEAELIADLVRRDLPCYDTTISRDFISAMNAFSRACGILSGDPAYEEVVAILPDSATQA